MAKELKIEVHKRDVSPKKSYLKTMRNEDKVPGVYYSFDSKESVPLYIEKKIIKEAGKSGTKIFNITVGDENKSVIFKSIQYHPVTDEMIHVDLYGVNMNKPVRVKVHVHIIGSTPVGVKVDNGVLQQPMRELHIECLPDAIPDQIEVDASELSLGRGVHVREVKAGEGIKILDDPNAMVVNVVAQISEAKLAAMLAGEAAEPAESAEPAAVAQTEEASAEKAKPEAAPAKEAEAKK